MKREIKFRVWKKSLKRFSPEYYDDGSRIIMSLGGRLLEYERNLREMSDDFVIEQYTGLKDKNGVEIYEGDVIRIIGDSMWKHEGIYTVGYDKGSFNLTHQSLTMGMRTLLDLDFNLIEVLGNIHEGNFKDNVKLNHQKPRSGI